MLAAKVFSPDEALRRAQPRPPREHLVIGEVPPADSVLQRLPRSEAVRTAMAEILAGADERARHELYQQAEAAMGRDSADTLMSLLPPVGWADVATKHDLGELEARLDARFDGIALRVSEGEQRVLATMHKELNGVMLKMFAMLIALVPALVIPLVTLT